MDKSGIYEIINGCKNNHRNSQKLLFELYAKKMMGVCMRYSPNYETARDMVQDGFIKVFTKILGFKGDSSIETWMTRIFINTCLSNLNKAENKSTYVDVDDPVLHLKAEEEQVDPEATAEAIRNLPIEKILEYINLLPEKYRVVINMYSIDGMSHQQIAEILNIQLGSSKSRLSGARVLLNEIIKTNEQF